MVPLLIRVLHICLYTLEKCGLSRLRTDGHTKWKVVLEESAIYYHASECTGADPGNIAVPSPDRSRFD